MALALTIAIILVASTISVLSLLYWFKQKDRPEETINEMMALLYEIDTRLSLDNMYFMEKDYQSWRTRAFSTASILNKKPIRKVLAPQERATLDRLNAYLNDPEVKNRRNLAFLQREKDYFSYTFTPINGYALDDQQIHAVLTDEYNNLIVAGAGSGKTLTVVAKINYLVRRWGIKPEEILALSYTRKAVDELRERIERSGIVGVRVTTFHSLGLSILGSKAVANEGELRNQVKDYLRRVLPERPNELAAYLEYVGCYSTIPKDLSEFDSVGESFEELKASQKQLDTLKGVIYESRNPDKATLKGERVKSFEELQIANYLYLRGIRYEYEKKYPLELEQGRAYQPDFYLTDYDIWLEHFGINEEGRAPWLATEFEEKKYLGGIQWKRKVHKANKTKLIETYSFYNKDNQLLERLEALLKEQNIPVEYNPKVMDALRYELKQDSKLSKQIISLISTFISLYKANNLNEEYVKLRVNALYQEGVKKSRYLWYRASLFTSFVLPIANHYKEALQAKDQIDFDDMINDASVQVSQLQKPLNIKYLLIDEYQDSSFSRFNLATAIRTKEDAKLICVGDDWQSIYRFAGSDISLFTNFGKHVGYFEELKIERTYRNSSELVKIASNFILKNPSQIKKTVVSSKHLGSTIKIVLGENYLSSLQDTFSTILSGGGYKGKILMLGRHVLDLFSALGVEEECLKNNTWVSVSNDIKAKRVDKDFFLSYRGYDNIQFLTVHKAKGLEAEDVIILNLVNDRYGFPNKVEDDPILNLVLAEEDKCLYAEERRLFYVALTRTKNRVFLLSQNSSGAMPSEFVQELCSDYPLLSNEISEQNAVHCPRCGKGVLVLKVNSKTHEEFLGCSSFPYCEKTYDSLEILNQQVQCPRCKGYMIKKLGPYGPFYGCDNYPSCDATINIEKPSNKSTNTNKGARCPKCGGTLVRRISEYGPFYGCSNYPSCEYTTSKL